ncbi:uncharacterized protein LOC127871575 [Dreissena polymorpha]|uniref:uncharacterized protein LOC127871575 n=1 Tax=Dreissena polymorpha TaxID=45954 RepID=UPI0022654CAE|nr:uncharacterized protein LOC127871575 [Dreissena polymorpha]
MFVLHHEDHQDKAKGLDKGKTLNNLMTVNLQGPSISEFDPKEAVEPFMVSSKRRAGGYQKKTSRIATSDVLTEEGQPQVETSDIEECDSEDTKEAGSDEEADLEVDKDEIN